MMLAFLLSLSSLCSGVFILLQSCISFLHLRHSSLSTPSSRHVHFSNFTGLAVMKHYTTQQIYKCCNLRRQLYRVMDHYTSKYGNAVIYAVNLPCYGPLHEQIWKCCNLCRELTVSWTITRANMEVVITH